MAESTLIVGAPKGREAASAEQLADLGQANADLAQAVEGADVTAFHSCTRKGPLGEEPRDTDNRPNQPLRTLGTRLTRIGK